MTTTPALLLTADPVLVDDVVRLAAGAGVGLDVLADPDAALVRWSHTGLVLVGADCAPEMAALRPSTHPELHVVARGAAPDGLFRFALRLGARGVVELPDAGTRLAELLADLEDGAGATAHTLGVVGGSGGAGASTLAAALAMTAARNAEVLLLDLDPWGPGLDQLVGIEGRDGVRWDSLTASGRLGSRSLREALPARDRLAVLTWASGDVGEVHDDAVREVLAAAQRGNDAVVIDLPRSLAGVAAEVAARCDEVILVVTPTVPGVAAASRVAARLRRLGARPGLAVRSAGGSLTGPTVAEALTLPLRAAYPSRRRVPELVDLGLGPVGSRRSPLARAAREVLR